MPRASLLLLAAVLALGGCQSGGDDPGATSSADPAAIRSGLASLFAGDHPGSREEAEGACFAEHLTESVTPRDLRSAGVLDSSYDVVAELPPLPADVAGD